MPTAEAPPEMEAEAHAAALCARVLRDAATAAEATADEAAKAKDSVPGV